MFRFAIVFGLCCWGAESLLVVVAAATLSPPPPRPGLPARSDRPEVRLPQRDELPAELRVTEGTEVLLAGRPCRYADVPPDATVIRIEVSPLDPARAEKIHFRSGPPRR
jgi:hypothetical protein